MQRAHDRGTDWMLTPDNQPRGYIRPHALDELWFHTGTACNLSCPFCLEGSTPGDNRLERVLLSDLRPFIDEALTLNVRQFSFTGGEPFIIKDIINILTYAATHRPCLVLTNGTDAVLKRLHQIRTLRECPHPLSFRISIDYTNEDRHDAGRGAGNFRKSLAALHELHAMGFTVSVARQMLPDENTAEVETAFSALFTEYDLPPDLRLIAFPDFGTPGSTPDVPAVTENCMTRYQDEQTRRQFMCATSKMVIKKNGRMRVYACTLVDDDEDYDLGGSLTASMAEEVRLRHQRCYSCFKYGASCSEL